MIYVSKQLEKAGVDFIHVSGGNTIKRGSSMPAPGTAPAPHAHSSEEIKKHVHIPVATVARINEPWIAEELIANGKTDICMIGRPNCATVNLPIRLVRVKQKTFVRVSARKMSDRHYVW